VRHKRHYTLQQANAVRPWVARRVGWIRAARARLVALGPGVQAAIADLDPDRGGSYPGRDIARSLVELSRSVGELEAVDVVLRDVDKGLIDFPAIRGGEEVYLCWLVDEDEIGYWHPLDSGFAGRTPL
jgi:hypothetical protein